MSTVDDRFNVDLTAATLIADGRDPLVAGDDWTLRFQIRSPEDVALSLDGAAIVLTIQGPGSTTFTRTLGEDIAGSDPAVAEIELDDQATEDTEAETGTGWGEAHFSDEDEEALRAIAGKRRFDIRVRFGDAAVRTFVRGIVEIIKTETTPAP